MLIILGRLTFVAIHVYRTVIPHPATLVWDLLATPAVHSRLLPGFYPLHVKQPAADLKTGTIVFGMPGGLTWINRYDLTEYQAGRQFGEVCLAAPVKALTGWKHVTKIAAAGAQETILTEQYATKVPAAAIAPVANYRARQLTADASLVRKVQAQLAQTNITPRVCVASHSNKRVIASTVAALFALCGYTVTRISHNSTRAQMDEALAGGVGLVIVGDELFGPGFGTRDLASDAALAAAANRAQVPFVITPQLPQTPDFASPTTLVKLPYVLSNKQGLLPTAKILLSTGLTSGLVKAGGQAINWISLDTLAQELVLLTTRQLISPPASDQPVQLAAEAIPVTQFLKQIGEASAQAKAIPKLFSVPLLAPKRLLMSQQRGIDSAAPWPANVSRDHNFKDFLAHEFGFAPAPTLANPVD